MLRKLVLTFAILTLAIPAFALGIDKDTYVPQQHDGSGVDVISSREDVVYNTGGAVDFVPTTMGAANAWAFWVASAYTNATGFDLELTSLDLPCAEYSSDPIALPVAWGVDLGNADVLSIPDPYGYAWGNAGTFSPVGPADPASGAELVYTIVDVSADAMVLPDAGSMVWGYENPGLFGMTDFNGVLTYGLYQGAWDPDEAWGITNVYQFKANYVTTATEDISISNVKALY